LENLISRYFLNNNKRLDLLLKPDKDFQTDLRLKEISKLNKIRNNLTEK